MSLPDLVDLLGVTACSTAFALLHLDRLPSDTSHYLMLNALGSGLILTSLVYDFNRWR